MEKKILIDWLTCTIGTNCFLRDFAYPEGFVEAEENEVLNAYFNTDESILTHLKRFLGLPDTVEFVLKPRGKYGYLKAFALGGIYLAWGGSGETIMIDLSGEGCRLLESLVPDLEWLTFIKCIGAMKHHNFSRLDVACDVVNELKMSNLFRYSLETRYLSRWKSKPRVVQGREEVIDFGSTASRTMLRIYNKTLERQCKVDPDIDVPQGWIRLELQMRNQAVDSFIREWRNCGDISTVYLGLMSSQLKFVKKRESNLARSETVAWWRNFLDDSKPIRLAYKGGLEYNLQSLERYLFGQAGSSIHTWLVANDWDYDRLLLTAIPREMNERQEALIHKLAAIKNART